MVLKTTNGARYVPVGAEEVEDIMWFITASSTSASTASGSLMSPPSGRSTGGRPSAQRLRSACFKGLSYEIKSTTCSSEGLSILKVLYELFLVLVFRIFKLFRSIATGFFFPCH
jgi:hypothetical protein